MNSGTTQTCVCRGVARIIGAAAVISLLALAPANAEEAEFEDFSDIVTERCEVIGLVAFPPEGWFNVPMQDMPEQLHGCQMMHVDEDEVLIGIIRLLSVTAGSDLTSEQIRDRLIAVETSIWAEMGIEVGEPIWFREEVPLRGDGFSGASAIGLSALITESGLPQDIQIITFRQDASPTHYALSLITPREQEDADAYRSNLNGYTQVFGSLMVPASD